MMGANRAEYTKKGYGGGGEKRVKEDMTQGKNYKIKQEIEKP